MTIAVDSALKRVTISGTSEASPQSIESVIDAVVAIDPINANRVGSSGWISSSWQILFAQPTDFLIISAFFTCEFRSTAAIRLVGSLILDVACTLIFARSSGLGSGNFATFQDARCKLVTRRYRGFVNPKVIVNCGASRSDIFGSFSASILPAHSIEGLDLIYQSGSSGFLKLFFSGSASVNNIFAAGSPIAIQQFSGVVATEAGCPTFNGLYLERNDISGEIAPGERYIRLVNCTFAGTGDLFINYRSTAFVVVDPVFQNGIPGSLGASDNAGNLNARQELRFTYKLNFLDTSGSPVAGARVRFLRNDGFTIDEQSPISGVIGTKELRTRSKPLDSTLAARPVVAWTLHQWTVIQRHYQYLSSADTLDLAVVFDRPISKMVTLFADANISLTEVLAAAIVGVSFDKATKAVTIAGNSLSQIYHRYRQWISQYENFDTPVFLKASADTIEVFNGWTLKFTSPPTPSSVLKRVKVSGGAIALAAGDYRSVPFFAAGAVVTVAPGETNLIGSTFAPGTSIVTPAGGAAVVTVDLLQLAMAAAGTGVTVQAPPVEFYGFPTLPNPNGIAPAATFGVQDVASGQWRTYDASSGSVKIVLPTIATGNSLLVRADAVGYYRTVDVVIPRDRSDSFNFAPLFVPVVDDQGVPIVGKGIPSEKARITFNPSPPRLEFAAGPISFASFVDKVEEITSSQAGLLAFAEIIRDLKFQKNIYAQVAKIPLPLTISAAAGALTSPILMDFVAVRFGEESQDVFEHGLPSTAAGLTDRPEVRENMSKMISGTSQATASRASPTVYII
jgi:hypothetical protein